MPIAGIRGLADDLNAGAFGRQTIMPESTPKTASLLSRLRPQFSLRALLIVFTAFAIGFPLWYRWPIREVKFEYPRATNNVGGKFVEVEDKSAPPVSRTVTTWKRRWGKPHVKSGPTTTTFYPGKLDPDRLQVVVTNYEDDELNGPYSETIKGRSKRVGYYEHGQRQGLCVYTDLPTGFESRVNWIADCVHGPAEIRAADGTVSKMLLENGLITDFNGQRVTSPLLKRAARGEIHSAQLTRELQSEYSGRFVIRTSLADWLMYTNAMAQFPLLLSPAVHDTSIDFNANDFAGLNLQSALVLATHKFGLECDYRYGCLWITTQDDAKDWHDPTGVDAIRPPPASLLSAAWNQPVKLWQCNSPLADAVNQLCTPIQVPFDTSAVGPTPNEPNRFPVRLYLSINGDYPLFRDFLAILLYTTGCRCKLDGDKLMILPAVDQ
jgi:hypothetical protein